MPAQIEQLYRTTIRAAIETTLGNGEAENDAWWHLPVTGAAVERVTVSSAERKNVFMQGNRRQIVSQAWMFTTSHQASEDFLLWLLLPHLTERAAEIFTLDPEADGPSYCVETISEAGDFARYLGCQPQEIQIFLEERRIVQVEIQWAALVRETPGGATERNPAEFSGVLMPTNRASLASTQNNWGPNPRANRAVVFHGGQIILTRGIKPANYGPDGKPDTMTRAAWDVLVELYMPETPGITDLAFADEWTGRLALWLGLGPEHFRIQSARGFIDDEDLKGWDWRVRRLVASAETDSRRALLEFRA